MNLSEWTSLKILFYCKKRNISINKLATMSGMRQSTLNDVVTRKNQNPRIDTIERICLGLGITISDFFENIENETDIDE